MLQEEALKNYQEIEKMLKSPKAMLVPAEVRQLIASMGLSIYNMAVKIDQLEAKNEW